MKNNSSHHRSADEHLKFSRAHKKSTGAFYTPEPLAKQIARDVIFAWISNKAGFEIRNLEDLENLKDSERRQLVKEVKTISILDPAVGDGVFLLSAGAWLSKILIALHDDDNTEPVRRKAIVENCLYGVDLDKQAVTSCVQKLGTWCKISNLSRLTNVVVGNSLVGLVGHVEQIGDSTQEEFDKTHPIHWHKVFPSVFSGTSPGFDIVLGNPPYGSILGPIERRHILSMYQYSVGGGRDGTWNSAAHFLVRSLSLMKDDAQLGLLVPNSFLRVKQFAKTRDYLLNHTKLWKIVDEGSPFDDVTLEMVSLFCERTKVNGEHEIRVESRRYGLEQSNIVSSSVLKESRVFPIYHDHILAKILKRGQKHLLVAGRGRDIPKEHVRKKQTSKFKTPYITSGRSVQRYRLIDKHVFFCDDWFFQDSALKKSFENEFLVATKNYRYPRCILKARGITHGGGIVKITPLYHGADLRVLGLILNSKLVRQISIRYLTNYSQLTCCLNTGIMEELPLILPKQPQVYRELFDSLSQLHSSLEAHPDREGIPILERLADALVYSLYFGDDSLEQRVSRGITNLSSTAQEPEVVKMIDEIFGDSIIQELEQLGNFPASRKLRRY
ncbi:MAG: Type IIS restriction enzyme Eco57I [Candidatus Thorarchaeota archaeon AB_25]|nr:MAG: Type IIS restriction enzyme Eco57I [Candidatus Thorarchaeota archaeon AB_25]